MRRTRLRLALSGLLAAPGSAAAADFRLVNITDTVATVTDADAIESSGDIRVATFYTATTEASIFGRTRLQFDCATRRLRPESMQGIDPVTGNAGREKIMTDGWSPADGTVSDSRTMKLVCGTPETRDTYARHLPQADWRSAVLAAFAPLRGDLALAFDLPVRSRDLLCTGGAVVRPEQGPPVSTDGTFRVEVDLDRHNLRVRDALGPGVASDYAVLSDRRTGLGLGPRTRGAGTAEGRLDYGTKRLHIEGTSAEPGGGSYIVDLHCTAAHPLPPGAP